jgi:hypothetical protein
MRPALTWRALDCDLVAGEVSAWLRPDNRWFVYFDTWRADACPPLADAVARDLGRDLYVTLEDAEYDALDACAQAGFAVHRRESYYRIPADPVVTGLAGAVLPAGLDVLSAADADITRLRLLDDTLRQDVPGCEGWRWDAGQFRAETFSPFFDPATYLVAADRASGQYAGLVRIWRNRVGPAPGPDRDSRPVPAARGRQGAAGPGVHRARRPGGYERGRRGRRHERRVRLVADRTRRTTVRRQRGADQAAAGPIGPRPARKAPAVSRPLAPRQSGTAEPSRRLRQRLVAANQNRRICAPPSSAAAQPSAAPSRRSVRSRSGASVALRDFRWLRPSREIRCRSGWKSR